MTPSYQPLICKTRPVVKTVKVWRLLWEHRLGNVCTGGRLRGIHLICLGIHILLYWNIVITKTMVWSEMYGLCLGYEMLPSGQVTCWPTGMPRGNWRRVLEKLSAGTSSTLRGTLKTTTTIACGEALQTWPTTRAAPHSAVMMLHPDTLNHFFARFDDQSSRVRAQMTPPKGEHALTLQYHQVRSTLMKTDISRTRPDTCTTKRVQHADVWMCKLTLIISLPHLEHEQIRL